MEEHGDLPPEIIDDILLRLPAKSLCRFKCVSKPWKAMLSDHDFVIKHINRATENKDVFLQRRRVIFTDAADKGLYTMDLDEFLKNHNHVGDIGNDDDDEDEQVAATELGYIYREQPSVRVPFFHSCDGLILLELSNAQLYLINPVTSESKHLPKPQLDFGVSPNYNYHLYGFGFGSSTSQYQLVRGDIFPLDKNLHWLVTIFSVFKFEADSWRHKPGISHAYFPASSELHRNENGVLLHGRFHWLMASFARVPGDEQYVIVAFDPTMIKTQEIQLPLELSGGSQLVKVGAFREWLCITFATKEPHDIEAFTEFWIMKKYGVRKSWTKMRVSIPYTELYHSGFWTESHDLIFFGERLVMYNFDEEDPQIRKLSIRGIGGVGRVGLYIESLVSIRDLNKNKNINIDTQEGFMLYIYSRDHRRTSANL